MLAIKILSKSDIPHVMQLSDTIFEPFLQGLDADEDKQIWFKNYEQNGLLLGAYVDNTLAGLIFFYEKD